MIDVIDDVLPEELYKELQEFYKNPPMRYGWKSSKTGNDPHGHWNHSITNGGFENLADISSEFSPLISKVWQHVTNACPQLNNAIPIRCYINGSTYGVDGYFHRDSNRDNERTFVLYLNDVWNIDWAGETVVVDESDNIVKASIPKRNRAIIFPGKMRHCARGVSRTCYDLRKTFMFKTRERRTDTFEMLSKFLYDNGAMKKGHKNGSLHDHLVRVYQILEDNKFPDDVCLGAGLHSVFGTTAFKNNIFTFQDLPKLEAMFGRSAVSLATMFSKIDRPRTLETPAQQFQNDYCVLLTREEELMPVSSETFNALRAIECANLIDQNSLSSQKYPNLYRFWQDAKNNK